MAGSDRKRVGVIGAGLIAQAMHLPHLAMLRDRFELTAVADPSTSVRERVGDRPVYVSIDVDVMDPAHAPGTGTPEAGGLTSRELLATLRAFAGLRIVGADVVEVAPAYDHGEITAIAAANVVYELLGLTARGPR